MIIETSFIFIFKLRHWAGLLPIIYVFAYNVYHFIRKLKYADQLIKCILLKIVTSISNQIKIFVSDTNVLNFYVFSRAKWILQTKIEKNNLVC